MNQHQCLLFFLIIFFPVSSGLAKEPSTAAEYAARGANHYKNKNYKAMNLDYSQAVRLNPNSAINFYGRGLAYFYLHEYSKAISDFSKTLKMNPNHEYALSYRATAYFKLRKLELAILDYSKLRAKNPAESFYYRREGGCLIELGKFREAIVILGKGILINPQDQFAYTFLGISYAQTGQFDKAAESFDTAIQLDPDYENAYLNRSVLLKSLKQYDKAIADLTKLIEIGSNKVTYLEGRGFCYCKLKEYPKAFSDLNKAIELDPKNASSYNSRGLAYLAVKDFRRAKLDIERSIQLKPNLANSHESLGQVLLAMKDFKAAISAFDKAIQYNPKIAVAYQNRSFAWRKLGEIQKANADLAKARQIDPSIPINRKVALLIGVNVYQKRGLAEQPLNFAERDIERTATELEANHFEVNILKGSATGKQKATRANIFEALSNLLKDVSANDIVLVGFAGHGMQLPLFDKDGKTILDRFGRPIEDAYYCPVDAVKGKADTLISLTKLVDRLNQDGGINLVMVDACRDNPDPGRSARSISGNELNGRLPSNTAIIFSCSAGQQALETKDADGGHGVFFYHILEGLKGKAADRDGVVTWNGLTTYVQRNVNRKAREWFPERAKFSQNNFLQTPHELRNLRSVPVLVE